MTGLQQWQVDANWSTAEYPDDPGRVDNNVTQINPVVGANLSVPLGADLNVNVGATDVTVAMLQMGGTAGPVNTTVSTDGAGRLVFENNELNDDTDPDNIIPAFNSSRPLLVSAGVPGATNVITAPIFINRQSLDIGSWEEFETTNDLLISGPILFDGTDFTSSINFEAPGRTLTIDSNLVVNDIFMGEANNPRDFAINQSPDSAGTVILNGNITGDGELELGPRTNNGPLATAIINGAISTTDGVSLGVMNYVLTNNNAFSGGRVRQNSQTGSLGVNLISDSDDRVISAEMQLAQYVTIKGENSLEWAGEVAQTNARGFINLLPAGKTFTLSGTQYADDQLPADETAIPAGDTEYNFDGSGKTVVTGALKDHMDPEADLLVNRSFGKRGTGAVYLQGSIQDTPNISTFGGFLIVQGGNLHLATGADLGNSSRVKSTGGAIGLDNGTVTGPDSAALLNRLRNRSQAPLTPQGDLQRTDDFASGGLMLAPSESAVNLDFTTGLLVRAGDMSVAAPEQGMTYTGTVTPLNNTYKFGGGAGVITLPNQNQLTGARSLVVKNGHDIEGRQGLGGVRITATNNYTGSTRIEGRSLNSQQDQAAIDGGVTGSQFNGTTLTVTSLLNGGQASGIGASSNAASNLVIQGGALRYEGAATSTDRLFTIGTRGATIDSSGTGAVVFSNTGALAIDTAEARQGVTSGGAFGFEAGTTPASQSVAYNIGDTSDLVPGMQIMGNFLTESPTDDDEVITITAIQSPTRVVFSDPIGPFVNFLEAPSTLSFVDAERTFTLTGDNTGNNTFRPIIGDSATNVVNVAKEGSGKWILDAVNTYTGDTLVNDGVLSITNDYLADDANVYVEGDALFDLDFAGTDVINALFLAGASVVEGTYGAIGSGAMFESSLFTGTGLLSVTERIFSEIPGDYNNDGVVNAADYTLFRDNEGASTQLANDPIGGTIGAPQYDQWAANYGLTEPPPEMEMAAGAVPEPAAAVLGLMALVAAACGRRKS
ncbi:autotransporter-associated beta strand repeat-containing protein [Botrimarina sp.]|uniref:autotransporter-associated beta strand repeat-containing protein n=1 Tax=Botrimarina sp. TaxID=2795802 RepID=UPI0032F07BB0